MKVLVIDHDKHIARAIEQLLEEHEVWVERDASLGLAHALKAAWEGIPYDVVFCERQMHGLSGPDVIAALHAHADAPECVLLTKPLDRDGLKTIVARVEKERSSGTTRRIRRFATGTMP